MASDPGTNSKGSLCIMLGRRGELQFTRILEKIFKSVFKRDWPITATIWSLPGLGRMAIRALRNCDDEGLSFLIKLKVKAINGVTNGAKA